MNQVFHPTRIDIPLEIRKQSIEILSVTVAACSDLYSQVKTAHWNVKGKEFFFLHKLFDKLGKEVLEYVDVFAERIQALGGVTYGTTKMVALTSILPDFPIFPQECKAYIEALVVRLSLFNEHLRKGAQQLQDVGDMTTSSYYLDAAFELDKFMYFLESHLQ